ncbi:cyclohexanecarboxylate-CoA ligase [Belnapia rosea]|uniref:3-methylmercaptopropionyl-CoA ligase n=1 Tax=Belnapia rosea TaxID=938405 RepID=A0A1G7B129_9PROT|nr:cyclohexanecarboxylate-CoA ligase [Belnapia rosea]SDB74979.1 cyclohexanecarboxylate-CoA ligase [Belnapia rosea]SDE19945.1 cyclohexanecarboxylate-CoA ligase [Belnapia rosea]
MQFAPILPEARIRAMRAAGLWGDHLLTDSLDAAVAAQPGATAIVGRNSLTGERASLTYAELAERAERIALGLSRMGVGRGDVVSFQLPNWWQFTALHLACLRIGAVTNPLMPIFRERELGFMLGLAESKVFIVPQLYRGFHHAAMARTLRPCLPGLARLLVIGGEGEEDFDQLLAPQPGADARAIFAAGRPGADEVVQILFTSGTTGEPKGVMHTSNTLFSNVRGYIERIGLGPADVLIMSSPMAHQTGFMYGLMAPILLGAKVVLQDIWQPEEAADLIEAEGVTFTMASTPFLSDLADVGARRPEAVRSLRMFLSAGAPIPRVLARRAAEALGATIISAWGMTENGAATTTRPDDPPEKAFETDGCPLPGVELRVVDAEGQPLPADQEGRLQIRSASNFVGYLRRPEWFGTDAEGWFETGDLARLDADGYVRITGRAKDIIIRGGENIPVVEVEGLIYRHPAVQEAAVVAMPDARLGERACAFVVPRPGAGAPSLAELNAFLLREQIAKQYLPERLEVVEQMPKTPSGKIQKFQLRERAKGLTPEQRQG